MRVLAITIIGIAFIEQWKSIATNEEAELTNDTTFESTISDTECKYSMGWAPLLDARAF